MSAHGLAPEVERELHTAFLKRLDSEGGCSWSEPLRYRGPDGLPGWHVQISPVYSIGPGAEDLAKVFKETRLLSLVYEDLHPHLNNPAYNTIKLSVGRAPDGRDAWVTINGNLSQRASSTLASLSWPSVSAVSTAYVLTTLEVPRMA